jgi:hypothetical protein
MYQQLWGYKVEDKLYLGVREQKRLNTTDLDHRTMDKVQTPAIPSTIHHRHNHLELAA